MTKHHYGVFCLREWLSSGEPTSNFLTANRREENVLVTDKYTPTYDLDAIKVAIDDPDKMEITTTATLGALELGFGRDKIIETVKNIQRKHFYKSMTTYKNHRVWQDVYRVPSEVGLIYVKFVAGTITEFALVGFKEK